MAQSTNDLLCKDIVSNWYGIDTYSSSVAPRRNRGDVPASSTYRGYSIFGLNQPEPEQIYSAAIRGEVHG